ncbi:protein of unknown function (plasmid) [Cupriavidus neocaledonicus]|uniref:Uncharacterized protein n=1 Tax=Cupriavidus neocaledonicus TaxID=1040979 RepID=A0A375HU41_9BURK|nr:hypothetical protein CBM2605_B100070 [Cupriavidus neocaledonicus]SPD60240.1 protein of unknown function [Cupriavidus neocaledonicus]
MRHGGLPRFGQTHRRDVEPTAHGQPDGPQTPLEKIVQRHLPATPVTPARPVPGDLWGTGVVQGLAAALCQRQVLTSTWQIQVNAPYQQFS